MTNDQLDAQVIEQDAAAECMTYGDYVMRSDGVWHRDDNKEVWICGRFEVLGRARDPQGDDWSRWIRFRDEDGRVHELAIKDADLHAEPGSLAGSLARQGLKVCPAQRRKLVDYINGLASEDRVNLVARTGWHSINDTPIFKLPDRTFCSVENETVILTSGENSPYSTHGTLKDWRDTIGKLTGGQRLGVLAISTAFAGPLLELVRQDGGGIHLRGLSSIGKTSLLRAATSVWGPPGFARTWRATANALEAVAESHTDTLLALDELNVGSGREIYATAYQLSAGVGKGRAHRDGSARRRGA